MHDRAEQIPGDRYLRRCSGRRPRLVIETDRQIFAAASGIGFMTVRGFPGAELLDCGRSARSC